MLVQQSRAEAETHLAATYSGDSQPLSNASRADRRRSLDWWLAGERNENPVSDATQSRRKLALRFYIWLGSNIPRLQGTSGFASFFEFSCGRLARPDKGVVKALHKANLICADQINDETIFVLTPAGERWINSM